MKVSEIFYSLQGEGSKVGIPSVFLRLSGCNLHCQYCDTKYAWDESKEMSIEEVRNRIKQFKCCHLTITGGEPLLQQDSLIELLEKLKLNVYQVEIETNGTIAPKASLIGKIMYWNISPKLSNSHVSENKRRVGNKIVSMLQCLADSSCKFVISNDQNLKEAQEIIKKHQIPGHKIILMPEAGDRETLIQRSKWLAEACQKNGYRLGMRLQVLLNEDPST